MDLANFEPDCRLIVAYIISQGKQYAADKLLELIFNCTSEVVNEFQN